MQGAITCCTPYMCLAHPMMRLCLQSTRECGLWPVCSLQALAAHVVSICRALRRIISLLAAGLGVLGWLR